MEKKVNNGKEGSMWIMEGPKWYKYADMDHYKKNIFQ